MQQLYTDISKISLRTPQPRVYRLLLSFLEVCLSQQIKKKLTRILASLELVLTLQSIMHIVTRLLLAGVLRRQPKSGLHETSPCRAKSTEHRKYRVFKVKNGESTAGYSR